MSERKDFLALAGQEGSNLSELCRRFGISRKSGYKWLERGPEDVADRSRRPHQSPKRTPEALEQAILVVRDRHPYWGPRKLLWVLRNAGLKDLPAPSTVSAILLRHGRVSPTASAAATPFKRFEHDQPNALWQMDFKGHFPVLSRRCHPLTVTDDHSRFNLVLQACKGETREEVQPILTDCFRKFGMPVCISVDNGPPWGNMQREDRLTELGVWLIRLGIRLSHASPRHPQTNGKAERFHRTLLLEVIRRQAFSDFEDAQRAFDRFRLRYNHQRPHQSLGMEPPASRYTHSPLPFPEQLLPIEYPDGLPVRKVDCTGCIYFENRKIRVSKALRGQFVALQPSPEEPDQLEIRYFNTVIRYIDLSSTDPIN
jgi:transposase InsO family protein